MGTIGERVSAVSIELQDVVLEEIERAVLRSRKTRMVLSVETCSSGVAHAHPGSGLSLQQIADLVVRKAVAAGVQLEVSDDEPAVDPDGSAPPSPIVDEIQSVSRQLVFEEIARIVALAKARGEILVRAGYHAGMLAAAYPGATFSVGLIIDEIILAAAKAGLAVEMDRHPDDDASTAHRG